MSNTTETTETLTINILASSYDSLFKAASSGTDAEILDAIAGMIDACPEVADWFATEAGICASKLRHALNCGRDALGFAELDSETGSDETLTFWSSAHVESEDEPEDIVAMLDAAAAFGTLEECLDVLAEEDPIAYEVIAREQGLGQYQEHRLKDVAEVIGRSGEMTRRYRKRGYSRIRERLEARGVMTAG